MGRWIVLLVGCGFSAVENPNINADLAGVDFAGADFAVPEGADLSVPPGADLSTGADLAGGCNTCNCGQPVLVMAIQSVNGGTGNDGRILQFGLGGIVPLKCGKDLQVGKTLDKQPRAIAWFPPDGILYAGETTLYLIDAAKISTAGTSRPSSATTPSPPFRCGRTPNTSSAPASTPPTSAT